MSVFNTQNTEWVDGNYSLFLGQEPALYDSINKNHPKIFEIYKLQKSIDWSEDEINLEQSRLDFLQCNRNISDIMLKNLAFQWELDSVASRSIAPLFAPFVTNSELWAALSKQSEIEILHSLTYSEIIRQCIPNIEDAFNEVMRNQHTLDRAKIITKVFNDLERAGAEYKLGIIGNSQETYNKVFLGMVALYCLERIQFMSSFAATFAIVEQGPFQGIGKYVQKIMQDELGCHAALDRYVVIHEAFKTERGKIAMQQCQEQIKEILSDVLNIEYDWNAYLFSEGRSIVGANEQLFNSFSRYNSQDVYDSLGIELPFERITKTPLVYMDNWIDIDKFQVANQESDNANYSLNVVKNDIEDDEILEF